MNFLQSNPKRTNIFLSPEYGGDAVSGGGHPADSPVRASEAIDEALGQEGEGHGKTPGTGEPGSQSRNPSQEEISQRAEALWEEEGRPDGKAEEHWSRAEAELRRSGS